MMINVHTKYMYETYKLLFDGSTRTWFRLRIGQNEYCIAEYLPLTQTLVRIKKIVFNSYCKTANIQTK